MASDEPSQRLGRARTAVSSVDWRTVLFDLLFVLAWFGAVSVLFQQVGWPTWLYYVVVFGGVVGYSVVSDH